MFVGKIDSAQFLLRRDLIGETRFKKFDYKADGYFIEEIYKRNPDDFIFIDKVLCYYNFIETKKSNSLPRILVLGTSSNINLNSKFYADFEATELNVLTKESDSNFDSVVQEFNPDSIITLGDDYSKFPKLSYHSYDIRKRWLHFNQLDSNSGESAYQCATNVILNPHYEETPLISFFTPIYNTGDKLYRTFESVKNQSYSNWEWVMVNDSTDGGKTLKIAEDIASKDCRVKVYDFGKKSGGIVGESKYRAASLCNGKYLMELDHDDFILPDAGYYMVEAFKKHPDAKFVYSDCAEIDENHNSLTYGDGFAFGYGSYKEETYGTRTYKVANTPAINPKTIRHIVGVPNHFRAWDRVFYHSIGGHNRRLTIADDYELIVRTFLKTRMVRVPKLLYLQFYHNANTQNATRKDIQRRVRSISNFYNMQINKRFIELGFQDWAYDGNPNNPLMTPSRFDQPEVNYIYQESNNIDFKFDDLVISYNL
jgi:glycosyltransferase involved in cell wall biosynthesis